jgi:hypothetical protein
MMLLLMMNLGMAWGEQAAPEGAAAGKTQASPRVMGAMKARG